MSIRRAPQLLVCCARCRPRQVRTGTGSSHSSSARSAISPCRSSSSGRWRSSSSSAAAATGPRATSHEVLELATGHDEDDLLFEASTSHKGFEAKEAADALRAPLLKALSVFVAELEALEL